MRADLFAQIPFRPVRTIGEDLLWAREALEAGWTLIHESASRVYHSHPYTVYDIFCRNVDDGVANRDINGRLINEKELLPLINTLVDRDWHFLHDTAKLTGDENSMAKGSMLRRMHKSLDNGWGSIIKAFPRNGHRFLSY